MTCVAGLVSNGKVWLAGDSSATYEDNGDFVEAIREPKVFRWGPMLVGFSGNFRGIQVLRYAMLPAGRVDPDPLRYLVGTLIPALREAFDQHGVVGEDHVPELLIGLGGRLFTVSQDFGVTESTEGFAAIGQGAPYAYGAHAMDPESALYAEEHLRRVLSAAEDYCPSVRGPFTVLEAP